MNKTTENVDIKKVSMNSYTVNGEKQVILSLQHTFQEEGFYVIYVNLAIEESGKFYLVNREGKILYNQEKNKIDLTLRRL